MFGEFLISIIYLTIFFVNSALQWLIDFKINGLDEVSAAPWDVFNLHNWFCNGTHKRHNHVVLIHIKLYHQNHTLWKTCSVVKKATQPNQTMTPTSIQTFFQLLQTFPKKTNESKRITIMPLQKFIRQDAAVAQCSHHQSMHCTICQKYTSKYQWSCTSHVKCHFLSNCEKGVWFTLVK